MALHACRNCNSYAAMCARHKWQSSDPIVEAASGCTTAKYARALCPGALPMCRPHTPPHVAHAFRHHPLHPQALLQLGDVSRLAVYERALDAALGAGPAGADKAGDSPAAAAAEVVVADGSLALALVAACHPGVGAVTLLQVGRGWEGRRWRGA